MATEVHEGANGNVKKDEVEPLGELKAKEGLKKPADPSHAGDLNGCETLAEKEEPLTKVPTPSKQKVIAPDGIIEDEGAEEPQDGNDYSSEEEEGDAEGDEDARDGEGEPYEEDGDEEYVDDGEDDDGDDEESQPPPKRRK